MEIGIIGLGLMGRAMATRLIAAGHAVVGYDIAPAASEVAQAIGVQVAPDALSIGNETKLIMLSLMTSADRRALLWGKQNLAACLDADSIVLDTTTASPEDIQTDAQQLLKTRGARLIDVCVSGSSQVVLDGRALALIGDCDPGEGYRDILHAFCKACFFFGAPGRGNEAKLIVNLVFGLNRLVLAEALGLAAKGGFDLNVMLDVLKQGETYSSAMDTKGDKMIAGVYEPAVARLAQHAKDVHLILDYARRIGARVPMSETHQGVIDVLVAAGYGDLDNAAIFKAYE